MTGTTDNRSRTRGSAREGGEGGKVARVENRVEQSARSWRAHAGTGATGVKDDEKGGGNRCWTDGAADTGRCKNHESEESTSCCAGTYRQGGEVKVLDFVR